MIMVDIKIGMNTPLIQYQTLDPVANESNVLFFLSIFSLKLNKKFSSDRIVIVFHILMIQCLKEFSN